MNASELFKAGKLQEAIDAQIQEVKANPADHSRRLFLFELLAFAGDLDRARKQIDAVNYNELELDAAVLNYRKLLDSEEKRRRLYRDGLKPSFFADPPEHVQLRLEAVNRLRENRPAEAAAVLEKANAASPERKGELNGKAFDSFRDCDDLLGGVLEVMARGEYYWVPLEQVSSVGMAAPKFPRDLLWAPAQLEMGESAGSVFLPALYCGSHEHADPGVKLGRATDWKGVEGGPVLGVGAKMFMVGDDDVPLLEWRQLQFAG
jgi:type VI secretion system protein ImpE